jgi:hypothetical protein
MEINIAGNKEKVLERWPEYYKKHLELQHGTENDSGEEWSVRVQTAEPYVEPPNCVDIKMAISKFKNRKATGHFKPRRLY